MGRAERAGDGRAGRGQCGPRLNCSEVVQAGYMPMHWQGALAGRLPAHAAMRAQAPCFTAACTALHTIHAIYKLSGIGPREHGDGQQLLGVQGSGREQGGRNGLATAQGYGSVERQGSSGAPVEERQRRRRQRCAACGAPPGRGPAAPPQRQLLPKTSSSGGRWCDAYRAGVWAGHGPSGRSFLHLPLAVHGNAWCIRSRVAPPGLMSPFRLPSPCRGGQPGSVAGGAAGGVGQEGGCALRLGGPGCACWAGRGRGQSVGSVECPPTWSCFGSDDHAVLDVHAHHATCVPQQAADPCTACRPGVL